VVGNVFFFKEKRKIQQNRQLRIT